MSPAVRVSETTSGATLGAEALQDSGYDARSAVPETDAILADFARRAEEARRVLDHALGVAYEDGPDTWLDIYRPQGTGPHPVFVFIHGGFWRAMSARESAFMAEAMAEAGLLTVSVNYGLAPATRLDEITRQCRQALRWIGQHIGQHGGDPSRLVICGHSAGAHLAAMACARDAVNAPPVRLALLISGLFDLAPLRDTHANTWLDLDDRMIEDLSPVRHPPAAATPVVLTCGEYESEAFKRQTDGYFRVCAEVGCRTRYISAPRRNHFDVGLGLATSGHSLLEVVREAVAG